MASPSRTVTASDVPAQPGLPADPAQTAALAFHEGDVLLGKYRVERVLGQGGMGVVLAVRHIELEELFAMKLMLPHALENARGMSRFLREARAAARLKGEHVAKVFDVGRLKGDAPYMVMEYLHGSDLKELLRTSGPLSVKDAVAYLLQACEALAEAHAQGIVHRDLKPSNLFLTKRPNGSACIKVIDFGISKMVTAEGAEQADLTKSGAVVGSPLYMSPEQMMQSKNIDARSDVWAMGVVLYELVTGKVPFEGETFTQIVGRVLNHEPQAPSGLRAELPPWLDAVILCCLRKKPEERFQSIEALAEALRSPGRITIGVMSDPALDDTLRARSKPPGPPVAPAGSSTLSTWGQTASRTLRATRLARMGIVAGVLVAAAAVALGSVWFGREPSSEPVPAPSVDTAAAPPGADPSPPESQADTPPLPPLPQLAVTTLPEPPPAAGAQPSASPAPSNAVAAAPRRGAKTQPVKTAAAPPSAPPPAPTPPPTAAQPRREGVY